MVKGKRRDDQRKTGAKGPLGRKEERQTLLSKGRGCAKTLTSEEFGLGQGE